MTLDTMIQAHWDYSRGILEAADVDEMTVRVAEYFYKQAWKHAIKHEREEEAGIHALEDDMSTEMLAKVSEEAK